MSGVSDAATGSTENCPHGRASWRMCPRCLGLNSATCGDAALGSGLTSKVCTKCGEEKPLDDFYRDGRRSDGRTSHCKVCWHKRVKGWRKRNPEKVRAINARRDPERRKEICSDSLKRRRPKVTAYQRQWRRDNPEKARAHDLVQKAVSDGRLIRPLLCEDCNEGGRLEAHHDDYSKPLDVRWLCVRCHRREHREAA